jgi:hypothetical protein
VRLPAFAGELSMVSERNPAAVAAIGGLTVAIMLLLAGLAAATPSSADELSDIRANQQLLKQQLDQLSQPPSPGSAAETPGGGSGERTPPDQPPLIGGSFPRSFLIPDTNTSVTVGGSVQQNFGYGMSR